MPQPEITSRHNPKVKEACALRNRSTRNKTGQSIVYGVRESARAMEAGATVVRGFVCREVFRSDEAEQVAEQLAASGAEVLGVSREVFEKVAYGDRLDGVVSIVATRTRSLAELKLPERPLLAVIDRIEKPGNLGAILRSADGAGIDGVVVVDPVVDLFNPNTIRASVASVFRPNIAVASAREAQQWLTERGIAIWEARPAAERAYFDADFTAPSAIVLGSEAWGLGAEWEGREAQGIGLPMLGVADSLNVSAAAAVLFYEARRQRTERAK